MQSDPQAPKFSHLTYLDGWRGVAILLVLGCHFAELEFLAVGVTVFFVLSGLLMANILFIQRISLRKFYWRRASRILPGLWVYLLVAYGAGYIMLGTLDSRDAFATVTFLRTYFTDRPLHSPIANAHIWSLAVEEHAYLALSLLAAVFPPNKSRQLRLWLTASVAFPILATCVYKLSPSMFTPQFQYRTEVAIFPLLLSAGATVWQAQTGHWNLMNWRGLSPICFVMAIASAFALGSPIASLAITSVLLTISIQSLHASQYFMKMLAHPVLTWFGLRSYSIYLWQQLFYWHKIPFPGITPYSQEDLILAAGMSVLAGYASYRWVELPARNWLNAFGERNLYDGVN